ncbi:rod shape-determining protein MreD [Caloramator quimbayensis]|uniref:Rod shape-determining protein MreD n=1 Tax=Caloramator quimbayensis TaxID=1147123 RepID=A0A1T4XYD1_9CLOT|nr:rod shape-determining protein MreD [Caloramator quimbayensis]SKA94540.1 rod shape-determining protein MreD [Caloramator quimbayensis]
MKKYTYIIFISLLIIALQQALISQINFFGAAVDIVFVFIISFALLRNEIESVFFALFCGVIRDCFFPFLFGINSIVYVVSAYILSQVQKRIFKDSLIIPAFFTFIFTILKIVFYFSYFYIASIKFEFRHHVFQLLILEPLYNSIVSLFLYGFTKNICLKDIMSDEWKF